MKKKMIALVALLVVMLSMLAGCGAKAVCDFCGDEKNCETRTMLGEELHICEDCAAELGNLFG